MEDNFSNNIPLVSVVIVTYNSDKFIIETLNSCINQTYQPLEIIISDDGSTDETLELCENWRSEQGGRRVVKIITSDLRKGIPANCNRGADVAEGEWIKFLGADDLLRPDAIENLMSEGAKGFDIVYSKFQTFGSAITQPSIYPYHFTWRLIKKRESKWTKYHEWLFLLGFSNVAPGAFIKSSTFFALGKYNEDYYLLEDLPLWYKAFNSNYKITACESVTVDYRVHREQVTSNGLSPLLKKDLMYFNELVRRPYSVPYYHNLFQVKVLTNNFFAKLRYLDVFQLYIYIINRLGK